MLQQKLYYIYTSCKEMRIEGDRFLMVEWIIKIRIKNWF